MRTLEFYNKHAALYCSRGEQYNADARGIKDNEARWDFLRKSLERLPKNAKMFEIGSGDGVDAKLINSLGYNIQTSDAAESFLLVLKTNGFAPVKFNVIDDDFPDSYDYILANAVFVHLTKPEVRATIRKVYDALNKGGRFVVTFKQRFDKDNEWKANIPGTTEGRFFSYWGIDEARIMLEDAGFKVIDCLDNDSLRASWLNFFAQKTN